jgi:hypothetical protein
MDQRQDPRFTADQPVVVTVLGERETQYAARIRNASGRGLAIEMPSAVRPGTALKMEFADSIVLGEAIYCQGGEGAYLLGVQLDQMLCGLTELRERLQEFAVEEPSGTKVAHSVNHRPRQHRQETQEK